MATRAGLVLNRLEAVAVENIGKASESAGTRRRRDIYLLPRPRMAILKMGERAVATR